MQPPCVLHKQSDCKDTVFFSADPGAQAQRSHSLSIYSYLEVSQVSATSQFLRFNEMLVPLVICILTGSRDQSFCQNSSGRIVGPADLRIKGSSAATCHRVACKRDPTRLLTCAAVHRYQLGDLPCRPLHDASHQLVPNNLATSPLDGVHQGGEDLLCDGALAPAAVGKGSTVRVRLDGRHRGTIGVIKVTSRALLQVCKLSRVRSLPTEGSMLFPCVKGKDAGCGSERVFCVDSTWVALAR